jgi:hypothetical protein
MPIIRISADFFQQVNAQFIAVALIASSFMTHAQTREPSPEEVQAEYCATYLPCAIAMGVMNSTTQGLSFYERMKRIVSGLGEKKVRNASEWRDYLDGLSPAERQAYVGKCTEHRGQGMLDFCEKEYLTTSEYEAAYRARSSKSSTSSKGKTWVEQDYKNLEQLDDNTLSQIRICFMSNEPIRICRGKVNDLTPHLERSVRIFNQDKENMQFYQPFVSRAITFAASHFDQEKNSDGTIFWSPKLSQAPEPTGGSASLRALQGNSNSLPTATADTFASNVSARLKDDEHLRAAQADGKRIADNFERTQQTIFRNEMQRIEQEAERARQARIAHQQAEFKRQQESELLRSERVERQRREVIEADQKFQERHGMDMLGGAASSGSSSGGMSPAPLSTSSAANTRPAGDCLSAVRRVSGGIELQNNCGYAVEAGWCVIGYDCKNGNWGYKNQWTIGAGRSYPVSGSVNRMVNFAACTPVNASVISTSPTEYQCAK